MRVGALDLGTNSFHLLVADVDRGGHVVPVVREKAMLRLGDVVSRHGEIPPTAADQAVDTVRRFRLLAEAAGATEVIAKATSAIRRAANGAELAERIGAETGVTVDVISGLEEARLIFTAVRAAVVIEPAPALCFDLGGGSLEVMIGDVTGLAWATSLPLGVARLTAELVGSDPLSKADRRALRQRIEDELVPVVAASGVHEPEMAIGSSGTLESLAEMALARRDEEPPGSLNQVRVSRSELLALHKDIVGSRAADRLRMPGLDARRVDLIVAGSVFLSTALDLFDLDGITISEWALREGIVLDTAGRHGTAASDPRAIRQESVLGLARRCNWAEAHARQVTALALDLFDALRPLHGGSDADRDLLELAAMLHDIGEHVASSGHHKHGAYLVRNGQLRGFAPVEVEMLAAIIRWHRRGEPRPSDDFPFLDADAMVRVRLLAAILRVADGLDRSRGQLVTDVEVTIAPSLVLVRVREQGDAELEVWGARRKRSLLEKVLDREVEFTVLPRATSRTATLERADR